MELAELFTSTRQIGAELSLVAAAIVIIILDPVLKSPKNQRLFWVSLAGIALAFVLNIGRFTTPGSAFSGALSLDEFSAYFNLIILSGSFLAVLLSREFISTMKLRPGEYYALILFTASGMMFLTAAEELMSLFIGFEIMSVGAYVLSSYNRRSIRSIEAGIKYLVLGGFSSAFLLYGIALIYGASGTIHLDQIAARFDSSNPLYIAGSALILTGFVFKIGGFPFHQWIPDVYEGAPMSVTGFMSVAVKAAAFAILIRVFFVAFSTLDTDWTPVLWAVAILTMIVGNLAALVQSSIKRMLAYSSIAHAGYVLVGLVAAYSDRALGLSASMYYLFAYTFMNLGAFGVLAYLSKDGKECESYEDVKGLWGEKPLIAIALAVFMLSLTGMPPTIGFFAKYRIFLSAVTAGFYWLAIIGIIASVISAFYYLRVIVFAFMKEGSASFPKAARLLPSTVIVFLTLVTVVMGVFSLGTWELAVKAAGSLLIH